MGPSRRVRLAGGSIIAGRVVVETFEVSLRVGARLVDDAFEDIESRSRWNLRLVVESAAGMVGSRQEHCKDQLIYTKNDRRSGCIILQR